MTTVKELMHSGVESHSPSTPISAIAKTMKEKERSALCRSSTKVNWSAW